MKYLHTMIRIKDVDESLRFFCEGLGLKETRRMENEKGRFTLIFLAAPNDEKAEIELTYNWDGDELGQGSRNFGHLAYSCLLYTSPSPRDRQKSRMPSSA